MKSFICSNGLPAFHSFGEIHQIKTDEMNPDETEKQGENADANARVVHEVLHVVTSLIDFRLFVAVFSLVGKVHARADGGVDVKIGGHDAVHCDFHDAVLVFQLLEFVDDLLDRFQLNRSFYVLFLNLSLTKIGRTGIHKIK